MSTNANLIAAAVKLAGGRREVAEKMGISTRSIDYWQNAKSVPVARVRQLCEMGGNVITVEQILAHIEQFAREKPAAESI